MNSFYEKAIEFIYIVKQRFINQPSKYEEFARLLSSVEVEQDYAHLISNLKTLFVNDHPDLLIGLNEFLLKKYEGSTTSFEEDHHAWLLGESPSELFNKIRDRCIEKNDYEFSVLMKFSKTVLSYHEEKISFCQVDKIFKNLFKDDPDLYVESTRVLANAICNLYEKTMDVKEFYLFEMDVALSRLESTIKKLEKGPESLEECFGVLDFKCIKNLYNDEDHDGGVGEEMVEILRSDPVARVVVLQRLRQKKMQLGEERLYFDKIWKEIFEDIREKGRVCRHREFLRKMKKASTNGFRE